MKPEMSGTHLVHIDLPCWVKRMRKLKQSGLCLFCPLPDIFQTLLPTRCCLGRYWRPCSNFPRVCLEMAKISHARCYKSSPSLCLPFPSASPRALHSALHCLGVLRSSRQLFLKNSWHNFSWPFHISNGISSTICVFFENKMLWLIQSNGTSLIFN